MTWLFFSYVDVVFRVLIWLNIHVGMKTYIMHLGSLLPNFKIVACSAGSGTAQCSGFLHSKNFSANFSAKWLNYLVVVYSSPCPNLAYIEMKKSWWTVIQHLSHRIKLFCNCITGTHYLKPSLLMVSMNEPE